MENIEVLTDQKIRGGKHSNFVIERNWEFIEGLKCPRLNYGMSQKSTIEAPTTQTTANDDESVDGKPAAKRAKHTRFS